LKDLSTLLTQEVSVQVSILVMSTVLCIIQKNLKAHGEYLSDFDGAKVNSSLLLQIDSIDTNHKTDRDNHLKSSRFSPFDASGHKSHSSRAIKNKSGVYTAGWRPDHREHNITTSSQKLDVDFGGVAGDP